MSGFSQEYFEHYCYFEKGSKTPYSDKHYRDLGNRRVPEAMFLIYKRLFDRNPRTYVDIGCGTGEEMAFFLEKGCEVSGCDFSDYVLKKKNKKVAKFIKNENSLTFIKGVNKGVDIFWENTLQYLDTKDFITLMNQIKEKASNECLLGVLFDESVREHPYRQQVHPVSWWTNTMKEYGFIKSVKLKNIFKERRYMGCSYYVFVKKKEKQDA